MLPAAIAPAANAVASHRNPTPQQTPTFHVNFLRATCIQHRPVQRLHPSATLTLHQSLFGHTLNTVASVGGIQLYVNNFLASLDQFSLALERLLNIAMDGSWQ